MELFKKDEDVRLFVGGALSRMGKAAVKPLVGALKDEDPDVRMEAALTLGRIGRNATAAVPALIEALKDEDSDVANAAAEALKSIDPEAAKRAGVKD
jgi:vesicle coat complex subunit